MSTTSRTSSGASCLPITGTSGIASRIPATSCTGHRAGAVAAFAALRPAARLYQTHVVISTAPINSRTSKRPRLFFFSGSTGTAGGGEIDMGDKCSKPSNNHPH